MTKFIHFVSVKDLGQSSLPEEADWGSWPESGPTRAQIFPDLAKNFQKSTDFWILTIPRFTPKDVLRTTFAKYLMYFAKFRISRRSSFPLVSVRLEGNESRGSG